MKNLNCHLYLFLKIQNTFVAGLGNIDFSKGANGILQKLEKATNTSECLLESSRKIIKLERI
jgi:hypothetical protein